MKRWVFAAFFAAACAPAHPTPQPSPAPDSAVALTPPVTGADLPATAIPAPPPLPAQPAAPTYHAPRTFRRSATPGRLHLVFTGDINLGNTLEPDGVPPDSGRQLFSAVDSLLHGDLVIGNFEGTLSDTLVPAKCGVREKNCYTFRTPPFLAARLKEAGFTDLNLANNHAIDLGLAGRDETMRHLDSLGLRHYGPVGSIVFDTLFVGDTTRVVALVGFTTYPTAYNLLDLDASRAVVDSVRKGADIVVVTFHGGTEGDKAIRTGTSMEHLGRERRGDLRRWAHAMIDAGADAVIGHGPHVLRGIEFWKGKPIAYSLGNFLTWRGFSLAGYKGITAILELDLDPSGQFLGGRIVPLRQAPRVGPAPDRRRTALSLVRRLSAEDFPGTGARISASGGISLPRRNAPTPRHPH